MKINTRKQIRKNTGKNKTHTRRIGRATRKQGGKKATQSRKRKMSGGVIFTKEQMKFKNAFRSEFMKAFEILKKDPNKGVTALKKLIRESHLGINTLIPLTHNMVPVYKRPNSPEIIGFAPLLVVIYENIDDLSTKKRLTDLFINKKGNINLTDYVNKTSALSSAVKLQDKELVDFLLDNGADISVLTPEQKGAFVALALKKKWEADLNPIPVIPTPVVDDAHIEEAIKEIEEIHAPPRVTPLVKLTIPAELPETGYAPDIEPDFWKPIFNENEMTVLRQTIREMLSGDNKIMIDKQTREAAQLWSVCGIIKTIIPTYYTQLRNDPYDVFGTLMIDKDIDFSHFNILLCASLLVFGIVSYKMIGQDYKLLFKGGKAVQLVLKGISEMGEYKTEDIDVLIMPNTGIPYDENNVKNLAGHISYLIKWFLQSPETKYNISVLPPNPANVRANPFIFKLSYVKDTKKYDHRKNMMIDDFRQFSDVDFKKVPEDVVKHFDTATDYSFVISELNTKVLFRCPNLGALLDEKVYYYAKYTELKNLLTQNKPITELEYMNTTIPDCDRFLEKFKRAILPLNKGLQKQRGKQVAAEKETMESRLVKLNVTDSELIRSVIDSLYP
ncbi:MAG: hypothetical protein MUP82_01655 [Candidatus Marinimicrobia bacterium]|nr:hypothetical protein [Candidatus Neomarinimicrobiota bacterium]